MKKGPPMKTIVMTLVLAGAVSAAVSQTFAQDIGKKACMADAKRLCPAQVKALDRPGAERCLMANINQTTPNCHDTILAIAKQRADRTASKSGPDPSASVGALTPQPKSGGSSQ
jgi:hypothetical protein